MGHVCELLSSAGGNRSWWGSWIPRDLKTSNTRALRVVRWRRHGGVSVTPRGFLPPPWSSGPCNPSLWPSWGAQTLYLDSGRYSDSPIPQGPAGFCPEPRSRQEARVLHWWTQRPSQGPSPNSAFSEEPLGLRKQREKGVQAFVGMHAALAGPEPGSEFGEQASGRFVDLVTGRNQLFLYIA